MVCLRLLGIFTVKHAARAYMRRSSAYFGWLLSYRCLGADRPFACDLIQVTRIFAQGTVNPRGGSL